MNYILFLRAFQEKYKGIQDKELLFHYLREELQYLILYALYTKTTYGLSFMGGTQLRLSYGINRFSEDIDLSLEAPDKNFPHEQFFVDIVNAFSEKITGFRVKSKMNTNRNVLKMMLSFEKLLFDINLSPLSSQTMKIKLELDINPPKFATTEKKMYRSMAGDFMITTHDLATGFSRKLTAVLLREYQKGRDYYDLQWYLEQKPAIAMNLKYLNANCRQQGAKTFRTQREAIAAVSKKVKKLDMPLLRSDLERFIVMDKRSFEEWIRQYIPRTLVLLKSYQKTT